MKNLRMISHGVLVLVLLFSLANVRPALAAPLPTVAVYAAEDESSIQDVLTKLTATGLYSQVDNLSPVGCASDPTPSLATLQQYEAVLVWSNCNFNDPTELGNVLADYVDGGGRVVVGTFAFWTPDILGIGGRLSTGGYLPLTQGSQSQFSRLFLVADLAGDPLLAGVSSFDGGSSSFHNAPVSLAAGATLVAHWTNGQPLVAFKDNVVALNFYPPSSDARSDFWNSATDGVRLMTNALNSTSVSPLTDFRDVRRPNNISIGPDLGGTNHQALNFTGNAGAGGDTWITVYDPAPNPPPATFGSVILSADVLIHTFNNKKGAGLLALYNEASGKKGLALTLYSAGNTDTLVLATVDQAGKLVTLKTVSLGAAITENVWYRVFMVVTVAPGGLVAVDGYVFPHETPTDPNSAPLDYLVGGPLNFSGTLGAGALVGVDATGEVGILAAAVAAANSSSVTNISIEPQGSGGGGSPTTLD